MCVFHIMSHSHLLGSNNNDQSLMKTQRSHKNTMCTLTPCLKEHISHFISYIKLLYKHFFRMPAVRPVCLCKLLWLDLVRHAWRLRRLSSLPLWVVNSSAQPKITNFFFKRAQHTTPSAEQYKIITNIQHLYYITDISGHTTAGVPMGRSPRQRTLSLGDNGKHSSAN